jgi:hypothetical protein
MKLFYFTFKARAETSRLILKLAGVDFEDVQFTPQEWAAKYKAQSPSGQVRPTFQARNLLADLSQDASNEGFCYCTGLCFTSRMRRDRLLPGHHHDTEV